MTQSQPKSLLDYPEPTNYNSKMIAYLTQQKEEIIQKLQEQECEVIIQRKSRPGLGGEEVEKGLQMFSQGVKNILQIYFPILMQEKYMQIVCQSEIYEKANQIKLIVEKNWNDIYRQLMKQKQDLPIEPSYKRGKNCKMPVASTCILQKWLLQNFNDPYPSHSKKLQLAKQSRLTIYQVNNWFINARQRIVKRFFRKQLPKGGQQEDKI